MVLQFCLNEIFCLSHRWVSQTNTQAKQVRVVELYLRLLSKLTLLIVYLLIEFHEITDELPDFSLIT